MEFPPIAPPDPQAHRQAVARTLELAKPAGSLGRLEELAAWLAACQGRCPPRPFTRPRVVVFAGDHGIAARGVSAYPAGATARMVAKVLAGSAAVNVLATAAGATVRLVDVSVDWPSSLDWPCDNDTADTADTAEAAGLPEGTASRRDVANHVAKHKVRRSSGPIDVADALSADEAAAALAAGAAIADNEVDSGADLLVAGDLGVGNTTPAAVLVAALTGAEPVAVVGRGSGIDDAAWMRKTVAIRDALRRTRRVPTEPMTLLRTAGGADLAALAGFLAQAAVRRTPVLLDGVAVGAAAMVAEELAPGARDWWLAGHRSPEPAHEKALDHLRLTPILDLGIRHGEGTGALAALPLLRMAAHLLAGMAGMATAAEAGGPAV